MATGIVLLLLGIFLVLRTVSGPDGRKLPDILLGLGGSAPAPPTAAEQAARRITTGGVAVTPEEIDAAPPLVPLPLPGPGQARPLSPTPPR